jgi:hypothetical protein
MTTRINLYNEALLLCGERFISTLNDNVETRYLLDHVWDNAGVKNCLESGQWKFAMRTILADYDTSITPDFGYVRAFLKPTDWCLTSAVCSDEYFTTPLIHYSDEVGYWYSDLNEMYIKYVSDHADFGGNLSLWPSKFTQYVAAYFASRIILKITSDQARQDMLLHPRQGAVAKRLMEAKSNDAMGDPPKFLPTGSWNNARRRGRGGEGSGNRNNLIG